MNKAMAWMRGKAGGWLANQTAKRFAAPAGAVAVAAVCTAEPISWRRLVAAIAAVMIVPLVFFVPVRIVVAKRSNGANAVLLLALVALDVLCAAWAVRWSVNSWTTALVAVALVAIGLFYNVWIMTFALKLEEK